MRRAFRSLAFLVFAAGCGTPVPGNYEFVVISEESDCPATYSSGADPEGLQTIDVDMSVPELIIAGVPDEHCPLTGMDFACSFAELDDEVDYRGDQLDAFYTVDANMSGTFLAPTEMEGVTSIATTCDGLDCAALAEQGKPACVLTWFWEAAI